MLERMISSSAERLPVIGLGTWRTFDPSRITDATLVIPATATANHVRENLSAGEGRLPTPSECRDLVEFLGT